MTDDAECDVMYEIGDTVIAKKDSDGLEWRLAKVVGINIEIPERPLYVLRVEGESTLCMCGSGAMKKVTIATEHGSSKFPAKAFWTLVFNVIAAYWVLTSLSWHVRMIVREEIYSVVHEAKRLIVDEREKQ